jgi:(E)-4-hydroxy-3-methyl-but-2-enyl pyrophosphate reductase
LSIRIAKSAGFCFGVNRAVEMVNELLDKGNRVCTLGPIIHNPQTLTALEARGVKIVDTPEETPDGAILVIRSHGVTQAVFDRIISFGINYIDATCPFVQNIHRIVSRMSAEGKTILIAGDLNHPEVQGIMGHCSGKCSIFKNASELQEITKNMPYDEKNSPCVVAQTTFSLSEWENCLKIIKRVYTNATIFDTICNATAKRQTEAVRLSQQCDAMVVIGGRQSSNTAKLFDVCKKNCTAYLIETADELPLAALKRAENIGITAGASTPASIIKEVLDTMSEIKEGADQNLMENNAEGNFEEMLEESLKSLNTDEKVRGVVVGITPSEVYVDVGRKQAGFVPVYELSADPNVRPEDIVKIGDELDLLIMRTNDQEGTIMLSKKRLDAAKGWEIVTAAEENEAVLTGVVTEVIKGGVIAVANGVRVFIPASQATASRGDALEDLLKKEVQFRIIEVNRSRRRAVGSIRSVLKDERKIQAEKFWETAEEGKEYTGVVKSLTAYGVFVDLGGIDGMIHISELSWGRIKHPSEVVNLGDTVQVYIKGLDQEKGKISLGYKRVEDNPWEIMKNDYPVGTVVDVTIVGMTAFGAFAKIIPGIDGLIHISQIADHRIEKPQDVLKVNDVVKAKITEIDFDKKRVSLSIRALSEPSEETTEETAE